ncbi:MAG: hypothetical protein WC869_13640 [Phycisphaerae bacterium]|jgi:hypothetical protein
MTNHIKLPQEAVAAMKRRLWELLDQSNADLALTEYARILAVISHPAAVFRGRLVKGTRQIQAILNTIIIWRRMCWLFYALLIAVAVLHSWWVAILCPVLFLFNLMIVNHWQTLLNVELAARLFVLDDLVECAPAFRAKIMEILREWESNLGDKP